ncbi:MAG: hypothetical protein NZ561_11525 [Phycisphaerae bacterium]|nr:hypothetical protein [Phycisphaerae bacterium]MDW8262897.1 hypothetical protein [Phycisphaerales bacterium]
MARKSTSSQEKSTKAPARTVSRQKVAETPVRNSAVPKKAGPQPVPVITHEMVAMRAFDIWRSGTGGDDFHNWVRAEEELRRELGVPPA